MLIGVGLSALLMLVVFAFSTPICKLLGATGSAANLLDKTRGYLIGIAIGLPAMNAMRVLNAYMSLDDNSELSVIASVVLTVMDIALDFAVAFVIHGDMESRQTDANQGG